ncbi:flagellar hook-length control protein FliK [Citromicrobium sp. JLT1363]|uniref:flagellar hook-length control protein FliK n=1 Tax=Citromicrobium sp. JLT1363 TaxID=517722 RepID=UPI000A01232F|nr:flagellar hook-length control protein FliK [Citromicrobium sp. JLT1363]
MPRPSVHIIDDDEDICAEISGALIALGARIDASREGMPPTAQSDEIPADAPAAPAAPALQPVVAPPAPNVAAPLPLARPAPGPVNTGAGDGARAKGVSQRDARIAPGPQESLGTVQTAILRPSSDSGPPQSPVNALANADKGDFAAMVDTARAEPQAPLPDTGSPAAEMPGQTRADGVRNQAAPPATPGSPPATVSARPGEIGHQLGVEIARQSVDGRDSLTIRLDPVEMGEIQIRLQFDDRGTMRALVSAESSAALEMLRRDSADLARALGDAGVRTDGQSFQFEARSHGRGDQQGQHRRPDTPAQPDAALAETDDDSPAPPHRLRASGSLDLFA